MILRTTLATVLLAGMIGTARAATLSATLSGAGLSIDSPCAANVDITPDPSLHDQAVVQASADHQEEIDHLLLESTGKARIHTRPGRCWHEGDHGAMLGIVTTSSEFRPTLRLSIRVPAAYPLAIDEAGAARYVVGAIGGPLSLDASGAVDFADGWATYLNADISGDAHVHVARAEGAATVELSGHGDITVDQATMPSLTTDLSGAGHIGIAAGHIGRVQVEASGAGALRFGAEVGDANVDISGVGAVHFAKVSGTLTKEVSGMGVVTVQ